MCDCLTGFRSLSERYGIENLVQLAQAYLSAGREGQIEWDVVGTSGNIQVFRAKTPLTNIKDELRWPCFKTISTINCSSSHLYDCLMDSDKIKQYSE